VTVQRIGNLGRAIDKETAKQERLGWRVQSVQKRALGTEASIVFVRASP
jgi:hypothetical protein